MKDMRAVRANEKLKRASTLFGNGGLALLVAGLSRWYVSGLDPFALLWIFLSTITIWISIQMNDLLAPEDNI